MRTGFFIHKLSGAVVSIALLALFASAGVSVGRSLPAAANGVSASRQASRGEAGSYVNASAASSGRASLSSVFAAASSTAAAASFSSSGGLFGSSGSSSAPPVSAGSGMVSNPASVPFGGTVSQLNSSSVPDSSVTPASSAASVSSAVPAVSPPFTHPARMTVGYYGGWAAYSGFTPNKISASNINILNYAFAKIGPDLKIAVGDSYIDYSNFSRLKALKSTYRGLRTVISVGGWSDSGRFSDAALTESSRSAFADSVVDFITAYGFDGVDIDWEYPTGGGLSSNISRPADRTNFGLLLKTLRSRLDRQGAKDNRHYILSFAGAANSGYANGVNLAELAKSVDYAMIMTYDLHGGWDSFTDFNAPLYPPAGQSPQYKVSVDSAVRTWLSCGFPAGKLVMGVPFYGYAYQGTANTGNGLWQHFSSAAPVSYDAVRSKYYSSVSYQKFYDSSALVPSLFNGSTFISYDDVSSIQRKAQYAVTKHLLGVGAWELSFDKSGVLISTVKKALE